MQRAASLAKSKQKFVAIAKLRRAWRSSIRTKGHPRDVSTAALLVSKNMQDSGKARQSSDRRDQQGLQESDPGREESPAMNRLYKLKLRCNILLHPPFFKSL